MREREFFHALDTLPRTPRGVLLPDAAGELRVFPVSVLGRVETRSARHLRTEARARYLELLGHLLERDKA